MKKYELTDALLGITAVIVYKDKVTVVTSDKAKLNAFITAFLIGHNIEKKPLSLVSEIQDNGVTIKGHNKPFNFDHFCKLFQVENVIPEKQLDNIRKEFFQKN